VTEWNSNDPDAVRVLYDLSAWNFEQQAELTAELAEAEIPHGWEGAELAVPEAYEQAADEILTALEQRLGIAAADYDAAGQSGQSSIAPAALTDDTKLTEFDLADWEPFERSLVADSLTGAGIAFRWENDILLVPTDDEAEVDDILDEVESGNIIPINDDEDVASDELPFDTLNNFFLAGERLRREPRDAVGLERLLDALQVANPDRPPRGVELGVWRRCCQLAEELADALVVGADGDLDDARGVAHDLHDLMRPLI
jgi:hypothetical protein